MVLSLWWIAGWLLEFAEALMQSRQAKRVSMILGRQIGTNGQD
jgi:hypothetical protein